MVEIVILSDSQSRVMVFVADFIERNGWPPTTREIADALGYSSPASAHAHLERLRNLGYLEGSGRRLRLGWRAKGQDAGVSGG